MILSAQTIRARALTHQHPVRGGRGPVMFPVPSHMWLDIEPFSERTVAHGMSYGLSSCGYDVRIKDAVTLCPGGFVLATTVERIALPADLMARVADKSSWARRGIAVQNTIFEPGWRGYPTLEISHHDGMVGNIHIPAGAPIAQLIFELLDAPTEQPYAGKYQDQPQEPVAAKEE